MKSLYSALPSTSDDDDEMKQLVHSSEELAPPGIPAANLSHRMIVLLYILCALTMLFAAINLAATIDGFQYTRTGAVAIEDLPRPDIFAGLPRVEH
ncbi:hypothetical protein SCP_1502770 [Sparassis crispa]|uniref:Uncharacterized protein n=1 Tax=Sparassis crispa TaxID=139825 RepID=A0A401H4G0_9APHY|nr:hypothetical protein SCP_1502770 [Sparassis crispa]GBE89269.1 hypothetical protein SCP_1502770 [Sparassis crispa]